MMEAHEFTQRQRAVGEQVLERVASDPTFRRQLLDEPEKAMEAIGLTEELRQLEEATLAAPSEDAEVAGHHHMYLSRTRYCTYWSLKWPCGY